MFSSQKLTVKVNVKYFDDAKKIYGANGIAPATDGSAGIDLRACLEGNQELVVGPGERAAIGTGIAIEPVGPGVAGFVYSRSGLGASRGLTVAQGVGLIDPDYRGEIKVFLLNTSRESYIVRRGDRIAQLVFQPFLRAEFSETDELGETERGAGGFGHTGKQ